MTMISGGVTSVVSWRIGARSRGRYLTRTLRRRQQLHSTGVGDVDMMRRREIGRTWHDGGGGVNHWRKRYMALMKWHDGDKVRGMALVMVGAKTDG